MIEYKGKYTKGRILIDKLEQYQKVMKGIYTTSVSKKTIGESPMAYKRPKLILENITNLVDINFFIKPIYNLKP